MNPSSSRANDIIEQLTIQLAKGWQSYLVAKHVHERRANKRISSAVYFFNTIEMSCLETAILTLSKLLVPQADSITIPYLLNFAEQNPSEFPKAQVEGLTEAIARHREQLETLETLVANIKEQRDRIIAHLDKLHVSNPNAISTIPLLDYREVESVFKTIHDIINENASYLMPDTFIFLGALGRNIKEDVEYITKLIEKDEERE